MSGSFDLKEIEKSMKGVFSTTREKEFALQTYHHMWDLMKKIDDLESRFSVVVNMINKHGEVLGGLLKVEKAFSMLEDTAMELEHLRHLPKTMEAIDAKVADIEKELDKRFPTRATASKKEKGKEKVVTIAAPVATPTPAPTPETEKVEDSTTEEDPFA